MKRILGVLFLSLVVSVVAPPVDAAAQDTCGRCVQNIDPDPTGASGTCPSAQDYNTCIKRCTANTPRTEKSAAPARYASTLLHRSATPAMGIAWPITPGSSPAILSSPLTIRFPPNSRHSGFPRHLRCRDVGDRETTDRDCQNKKAGSLRHADDRRDCRHAAGVALRRR